MHRAPLLRWFATLAVVACSGAVSAQTRIACLGDSITYGARIKDREHSAYPNWLDDVLGDAFEVRNFGVGGATLLRKADRPFHATKAFEQALAWQPHIAVVVLGTNDTCENARRHNWQHADSLVDDAARLIASLRESRADMRIVLCSPPQMFANRRDLKPERKADLGKRAPRIDACAQAMQQAARQVGVEYLELRTVFGAGHVSDGVHPTAFGAERIARRVAERIAAPPERLSGQREALTAVLAARGIGSKADAFEGFEGLAFSLPTTKAECRVFFPRGTAPTAPWIWRARFFGHQPALDVALLERGFHLAYCDVGNLYGAERAIERFDELYALLTDAGLNERVVLEGMSRGGLPIVNWAVARPQRVAAIYGDNPVVDIRSWPGGNSGKRSDADWRRCLTAYGLDEAAARTFEPVSADKLRPLVRAGAKMMLVLGMADEVVPVAENGDVLANQFRAAGGTVEVWRKPGNGHHPHGLHPVDPLLRAILRSTGFAQDVTTTPTPSVEYRSGAGWHGDSWRTQVAKMRALARQHPDTRIVFLGDSITQGLTGSRERLAKHGGPRAIDKAFGQQGAISLGLSGDRTEHLLYRIRHGALRELSPHVIVLQIGVNNVITGKHTATEVLRGIFAVIEQLAAAHPDATVLCCGPFPAGKHGSAGRRTIERIHAGCLAINDTESNANVRYLDLHPLFLNEDGTCNDNMRGDRVHISPAGQHAWMQAVLPAVEQALGR